MSFANSERTLFICIDEACFFVVASSLGKAVYDTSINQMNVSLMSFIHKNAIWLKSDCF